jgi:hypothetical protein
MSLAKQVFSLPQNTPVTRFKKISDICHLNEPIPGTVLQSPFHWRYLWLILSIPWPTLVPPRGTD